MINMRKRGWQLLVLALICLALTQLEGNAWSDTPLTPIYNFNIGDGSFPSGSLIASKYVKNAFFGTTVDGGANGAGTIYGLANATDTALGTLTTLYTFSTIDGASPVASLLEWTDAHLYGTTSQGGKNGTGTVFRISSSGVFQTIYNFSAKGATYPFSNTDGANPYGGLVVGPDGNLYGTTSSGGANGQGTIFQLKITLGTVVTAKLTVLHSFAYTDGATPMGNLAVASDKNLYGTTAYGGINGTGTVFKISTKGTFATVYSFGLGVLGNNVDGTTPVTGLTVGADNNLYGTTAYGGFRGRGTIFQVTTAGKFKSLYTFGVAAGDGITPSGGLVVGLDGNLYGTTQGGGTMGNGTVFAVSTKGVLTPLHSFSALNYNSSSVSNNDGATPYTGMCVSYSGTLYGTTYFGGMYGNGLLFKITLHPYVSNFDPPSGPIRTTVTLYGRYFTGATSVKFGALSATFTVISDTEITATVPANAISAPITVVTALGTGSSMASFTVTH